MRKLFFVLMLATAQSYAATMVYMDTVTGTKGGILKAGLHWNAPQPVTSTAIQFTITYNTADFTSVSITPGGDITVPNKNLTCSPGPGTLSCVVWAMSHAPIVVGYSLGTITMQVSPTAHSTSTVYVTNPLGSSASGQIVILTAGSAVMTLK
jgi:hypothetical protein